MGAFIELVFVLGLYFLPTIIAARRKHTNATPIVLVNLFLGWTLLGWVLALAWATANPPGADTQPVDPMRKPAAIADATKKTCPECAEEVQARALVCRFCGYRFSASPAPGETPPS